MLCTTSDEGAFNIVGYMKGVISFEEVNRRWDELGPLILFHRSLDETSEEDIKLASEVKSFYFGEEDISDQDDIVRQFIKMMGDSFFYTGIDRTFE